MSDTSGSPKGSRWTRSIPLVVIALVAVAGFFALRDTLSFDTLAAHREQLLTFRDAHPLGMALAFASAYIAIVAFSLPGAAVASVTGGFLFGLWLGTGLNVLSATIGACLIFLAARWGLGEMLARRMETSTGKLAKLKDGLRDNEVSVLFLLRLVPAVPFFVANLLPALVGAKFRNFVWTTALGIIPGAIVYTWIGVGVGGVLERGGKPDLSLIWEPYVIGPILGLCALAALPIVIRSIRGERVA